MRSWRRWHWLSRNMKLLALCLLIVYMVAGSVYADSPAAYDEYAKLNDIGLSGAFAKNDTTKTVTYNASRYADSSNSARMDAVKGELASIGETTALTESAKYELTKAIFDAYRNDSSMTLFLATQSVKADVASGLVIVKPAIPYLNTFLGVALWAVVVFYTLSTIADIFYITSPVFRGKTAKMGEGNFRGGGVGGSSERPWFISEEAHYAVTSTVMAGVTSSIGSHQAGAGKFRAPIIKYFKIRAISYVFVGLALGLLVTGDFYIVAVIAINMAEGLQQVVFK